MEPSILHPDMTQAEFLQAQMNAAALIEDWEEYDRLKPKEAQMPNDKCIPVCDFCQYYQDNGGGPEEGGGFSGVGKCKLTGDKVEASDECECGKFKCSICW